MISKLLHDDTQSHLSRFNPVISLPCPLYLKNPKFPLPQYITFFLVFAYAGPSAWNTSLSFLHMYVFYIQIKYFPAPYSGVSFSYQGLMNLFGYLDIFQDVFFFTDPPPNRAMSFASLNHLAPIIYKVFNKCWINKGWSLGLCESGWWNRPSCLSRLSFFP